MNSGTRGPSIRGPRRPPVGGSPYAAWLLPSWRRKAALRTFRRVHSFDSLRKPYHPPAFGKDAASVFGIFAHLAFQGFLRGQFPGKQFGIASREVDQVRFGQRISGKRTEEAQLSGLGKP